MESQDRDLAREILALVVLKILALVALWWFFVRDVGPGSVDAAATAGHFVTRQPVTPPALPGDPHAQ